MDKDLALDIEREGSLVRDRRPIVVALGEALPFRSGVAQRVIAHQVLEHSEDPLSFIDEAFRVGQVVEIETPSPLKELLFRPRDFHRWFVHWDPVARELLLWSRAVVPIHARLGLIFERLYSSHLLMFALVRGNRAEFETRFSASSRPSIRFGSVEELDEVIEKLTRSLVDQSRLRQALSIVRAGVLLLKGRARQFCTRRRHGISSGHLEVPELAVGYDAPVDDEA